MEIMKIQHIKLNRSFKWPKLLILSTYLLSLLSLAQPALASIAVTEGNNQSVSVGTSTADIYFRVLETQLAIPVLRNRALISPY
jgi:hypothetical protein